MTGGLFLIIYDLNKSQIKDIQTLYELCSKKERLTLEPIPKESKLFYVQYKENQLICFASCIFSDNDVEIRAMTHPDFRRNGYFQLAFSFFSLFFNFNNFGDWIVLNLRIFTF